jgi:Mrp family chromosome partitioning ATPase
LDYADATAAASCVDGVLLVAAVGDVSKEELRSCVADLGPAAPVLGVVLNKVAPRRRPAWSRQLLSGAMTGLPTAAPAPEHDRYDEPGASWEPSVGDHAG